MDGINAIKGIHEIGELNVLLSILYISILVVAIVTIIKKIAECFGIETKNSLYKKAQEQRIIELEHKIEKCNDDINKYSQKIHEDHNELKEIKRLIVDNSIENMRWQILDFSNAVMSGREYNKEQYDHVLDIHNKYEQILSDNHMTNGQVTASMQFVHRRYQELMEIGFKH